MSASLDETLIAKGIKTLVLEGEWESIKPARTNGSDIFIGAGVTRYGESNRLDIDLCAEIEALWGFVIGLDTTQETLPDDGAFYNDYDNPFSDNTYVNVGIPKSGMVILVLSATNETISIGDKLKCVDGVFKVADTNDNFQMIAEEAVTGSANTRKYFYARFVKN